MGPHPGPTIWHGHGAFRKHEKVQHFYLPLNPTL